MSIENDFEYGNIRARITEINSKFAVLESIESDEFWIINENLETIYKNNESILCKDELVDGSGVIVYGEDVGYYYNKFLRKIYAVNCNGEVDDRDIFRNFDISSCDKEVVLDKRIYKENVFFNLNDFICEL